MLIVARGCVKPCSCRFTHCVASAVPKAVVRAPQSRPLLTSCSDRRFHTQTSVLTALAARLTPNSHRKNPTFAPLAEYRGLPGRRNTRFVARISNFAEQCRTRPANPVDLVANPRARTCCEARVAVVTARRSCSIPGLICAWDVHMDVVGAAQVAPTPRIPPREVQRYGGSKAHGASESRPSNLFSLLCAQEVPAISGTFTW